MEAREPMANQVDTSVTVEASTKRNTTMAASQNNAAQFILLPPFTVLCFFVFTVYQKHGFPSIDGLSKNRPFQ
jgi:hypothetical protein